MEIVHRPPTEAELLDPWEPAEALRRGMRQDASQEQAGSVRRVRLGKRLKRILDEGLYRDFGHRTFEAYVEAERRAGEIRFGARQARSYQELASLELAPLWGTNYSMNKLLVLAKEAMARQTPAAPGAAEAPERTAPRPSRRAEEAGRCLRRAERLVAELPLREARDHGYLRRLEDDLRGLLRTYLEASGTTVEALLGERRERPRDAEAAAAEEARYREGWDREAIDEDAGVSEAVMALAGADETAPDLKGPGPQAGNAAGRGSALPPGEKGSDSEQMDPGRGGHAAGAEAATPEVPWHEPVVQAVVGALAPEEVPLLERHLLLALTGRPVAELLCLLRTAGQRLPPGPLRDDLGCWLRQAAQRDLEARWPYLYMFLTAAQLPSFRFHLHLLRAVALPDSLMEILEAAWAYWPLEDGGTPKEAQAAARLAAFIESGQAASIEPLGWAYVEAAELRDALARHLAWAAPAAPDRGAAAPQSAADPVPEGGP